MPLKKPVRKRKPAAAANDTWISVSPNGESFPLPKPADYEKEFRRLKKLVAANRKQGREIVVVMGVGFVGAVMAGIIADSVKKHKNANLQDLTPDSRPQGLCRLLTVVVILRMP